MSETRTGQQSFRYVAMDGAGRRVRGVLAARDEVAAFQRLKTDGLEPITLRVQTARAGVQDGKGAAGRLNERQVADFVGDLAMLLEAGSDIRTALSIIAGRAETPALAEAVRLIARDISGGDSVDRAMSARLGEQHAFVAALAAAGEAAGELAGGLRRAGEVVQSRLAIREQLVSALSYPIFVLITAVAAFLVILILVIPSIAPLAEAPGAEPGLSMRVLLGASHLVRDNGIVLLAGLAILVVALAVSAVTGTLAAGLDRLFLDGPARKTASRLVYGGFAIALGGILAAGAPISDALRLSLRAVRSNLARKRLQPVVQAVRQGESLSTALDRVANLPDAIVRLSVIGEESGALGPMLARAGRIEEQAALKRIEAAGRVLGPSLIVVLGALIGLMMAALLSGVTGLGQTALN